MSTAVSTRTAPSAPVIGGTALIPQNMDQAVRLAQAMSSAKLVPSHLHGDLGSCLMIVEQAMRWHMSPFAVAQCTSSVKGKLMYEGKLVAAAVECSGAILGGFDYKFDGKGDDRTITVSATRRGEAAARSIVIRLGDVKTTNEWWGKQPDQQLVYSGTRNWARRWAPSVMLGVYSPEEFSQGGAVAVDTFGGTTIEAQAEAPAATRQDINDAVPLASDEAGGYAFSPAEKFPDLFDEPDGPTWLGNLKRRLDEAATDAEVTEIGNLSCVARTIAAAPPKVKQDIIALISAATQRVGGQIAA